MEPVEVIARFDLDGVITPVRFAWRQVEYPITSIGRRWDDESGQHILVMVPGDRVFELIYQTSSGMWQLRRWDAASPMA
jgi:hypothetical protein